MVETEPRVGLPCVVRYTDDNQFYRSIILKLNERTAKVLFVDYGNTQDTPLGELKRMLSKFMQLPMMVKSALKSLCPLNGIISILLGVEMPLERRQIVKETCCTRNRY